VKGATFFTRWGPQPAPAANGNSAPVYLEGRSLAGMKWLKNPFVLVIEGFLVGAILFASESPNLIESHRAPPPASLDSSIILNPSR
jgi:hypothetical protein